MPFKSIHPFPARMAPEIAMRHLESVPKGTVVLDPMMGSGTTLKIAGMVGCKGIGFDVDPMALLISGVWNAPVDTNEVLSLAGQVLEQVRAMPDAPELPWIDGERETAEFVRFWFAKEQADDLRRLSRLIYTMSGPESDVLRVALSRLIVTKRRGASLGRDISHSRPHKVAEVNDFQVLPEFERSVRQVCRILNANPGAGLASVREGNAKRMDSIADQSIDYIMTSPPYFTAVDYFRGHRLALVWLGYSLPALRLLRDHSIGLDRVPDRALDDALIQELHKEVKHIPDLKPKVRSVLQRYSVDLFEISQEFFRVLKVGGSLTVVLADSYSSGLLISNTRIFKNAARLAGFQFEKVEERPILATKRYLPPPSDSGDNSLANRMKTEAIMNFVRK
jgi:DNA modification methylase